MKVTLYYLHNLILNHLLQNVQAIIQTLVLHHALDILLTNVFGALSQSLMVISKYAKYIFKIGTLTLKMLRKL